MEYISHIFLGNNVLLTPKGELYNVSVRFKSKCNHLDLTDEGKRFHISRARTCVYVLVGWGQV